MPKEDRETLQIKMEEESEEEEEAEEGSKRRFKGKVCGLAPGTFKKVLAFLAMMLLLTLALGLGAYRSMYKPPPPPYFEIAMHLPTGKLIGEMLIEGYVLSNFDADHRTAFEKSIATYLNISKEAVDTIRVENRMERRRLAGLSYGFVNCRYIVLTPNVTYAQRSVEELQALVYSVEGWANTKLVSIMQRTGLEDVITVLGSRTPIEFRAPPPPYPPPIPSPPPSPPSPPSPPPA